MNPTRISTRRFPRIIGHRGAAGHALENSLTGFRIAADAEHVAACDGIELDIRCTSDGELIVHHDSVLHTGDPIADHSLSRLRANGLRDGSPLPTLGEAFDLLAAIDVYVEIKALPPELDDKLLAALATPAAGRRQVHAFDHRVIARLHRRDASLVLGVLSRSYPVDPIQQVREAGASVLWQEAPLIDGELVDRCHDAGIEVIGWTANDAEELERLIDLGVDGICSDWPDRVRAAKQSGPRTEGRRTI